ncbi:MAG: phage holin family protein [Hominimerdicola sp.]
MKIDIIQNIVIPFVNWLFGGIDNAFKILAILIIINCIIGFIYSCLMDKKVTFSIIPKKFSMLLVVGIANLIDLQLTSGSLLRSLSLLFYIVNECLCLLQYLSSFGICIPDKLLNILSQFKKKDNDEENSNKKSH